MADTLALVYWFEELGQEHNDLVGKKCANLGEITKIGLPVPPGFALSVDAYQEFMKLTGAAQEIKDYLSKSASGSIDIKQFQEMSVAIRKIVEAKAMPREIEEVIVSHYTELSRRCHTAEVAVSTRSAGPVSHPGQYETHLNVKGRSDLIEKVRKVWSSSFNPRSLSFRHQQGMPLESDPIGVAVMKMVNARAAGVGFTIDPNTGDNSKIIIEAHWGLGESVVSGAVTPDHYVINKDSLAIEETMIAVKQFEIVSDAEKGTCQRPVPAEKQQAPCLNQDELMRLAELGKKLEVYFGSAQDFEWAIDPTLAFPDNVLLVQSRPVKKAPAAKAPMDEIVDLMVERALRHY